MTREELFESMIRELRVHKNQAGMEHLSVKIVMEHRTHQANIVRNLQLLCNMLAENMEGHTDARNEDALAWLEKVNQVEGYISYI